MRRIFKYVWKYKIFVIIPFAAMVIATGLDMINPYLSKLVIDDVITKHNTKIFIPILAAIVGITAARAIFAYVKEYIFDYLSAEMTIDLKRDLFNHIQKLPFAYFDNMNTGELMSRINGDIDNIWMSVSFGIRLLAENGIYFVVATSILLYLNWKLTLMCFVTMPLIAYAALKLEKSVGAAYEKISDQGAVLNTTAQENIAGVRLVKAFAREKYEIKKFLKMNNINYKLNMEQNKLFARYFPVIDFLCNVSVIAVITFGGIFIIKGKMTIGTLVAFNGYIWMLINPMRMIGWLMNILAQSRASAKKIFKIMDTEPSIKEKETAVDLKEVRGNIKFENVSFKYNDNYVLENINLDIKPGSTVAVMGATGAGKSSLANLIGRYYDVTSGAILIDGYDVRDLKLESFRSNMAVVAQDTFLFSDTIKNNIKFGKQDAADDEIIKACEDACAYNFIQELNDGFETIIGERGIGLSGGQKQRLSIARALVRKAKILILDDATSALDMETEYQLLKNLYCREEKVTTLIIAHRISAVKNADTIIFLDNGKIAEQGTHAELLNKKGKYYEVYCEQFKDFQTNETNVI